MKLYEEAAKAQQAQGGANAEGKADDNVVDAEYEEVNDDQNKISFFLSQPVFGLAEKNIFHNLIQWLESQSQASLGFDFFSCPG